MPTLVAQRSALLLMTPSTNQKWSGWAKTDSPAMSLLSGDNIALLFKLEVQ